MADDMILPGQMLAARVASGDLQHDTGQADVAAVLDGLVRLCSTLGRRRWLGGLIRKSTAPRGLYIHGGVGRGKTMLMDMFFAALPAGPGHPRKWRLHFHDFMVLAQDMIHTARQSGADDPIEQAASLLAQKGRIMCFDEMEVRDIADAMILSRLFTSILERGVVVVATSNRHADDLYKNGLHRDRFLPFIELLKHRCDMVEIADGQDWRARVLAEMPAWYVPADAAADKALLDSFDRLRADTPVGRETIMVSGREIPIARAAGDVAFIEFADMCDVPLAARDYLAIAGRFAGLVIAHIPIFGADDENRARRFMWLVDALYDRGRFLIASADDDQDRIYQGHQFSFEFSRTVSRLAEMTRRKQTG